MNQSHQIAVYYYAIPHSSISQSMGSCLRPTGGPEFIAQKGILVGLEKLEKVGNKILK